MHLFITFYFIFINLIGLISMGLDKRKAVRHEWRIKERTLFFIAIIGGSIGSICGMYLFRHKTRHLSFRIGMPAIFILEAAGLLYITFV